MLADTNTIDEKHARLGKNGACSMLLCGGVGMQAGQQEVQMKAMMASQAMRLPCHLRRRRWCR